MEEVISKDTNGSACGRGQCGGDSSATPGAWHDGTIILLLFLVMFYCFSSLDGFLSKLFHYLFYKNFVGRIFFLSEKKVQDFAQEMCSVPCSDFL
jgi:hypothetical protein